MSDFGTAAIFFVTFLVIAYLRSGDFATLALICGGGVFAALTLLSVKPYILRRFAAWGHVWEQASEGGYQQTRAMSAAASGGLTGVGPGEGWLHRIGAADTDLVFGMLCIESSSPCWRCCASAPWPCSRSGPAGRGEAAFMSSPPAPPPL